MQKGCDILKLGKLISIGIGIFLLCMFFIFILITISGDNGGDGMINSGIFNSAIRGIIYSIGMLSSVVIVCTIAIIDAIKKQNNKKSYV